MSGGGVDRPMEREVPVDVLAMGLGSIVRVATCT